MTELTYFLLVYIFKEPNTGIVTRPQFRVWVLILALASDRFQTGGEWRRWRSEVPNSEPPPPQRRLTPSL